MKKFHARSPFGTASNSNLENSESKRLMKTIAKGSLTVFTGILLGSGLKLALKMVLAQHYGPSVYGQLSLALAILTMAGNIGGLGLNVGITRFIGKFQGQGNRSAKIRAILSGCWASILLGIGIGLIIFLSSPLITKKMGGEENLLYLIKFCAFIIPAMVLFNYTRGVMRGLKDMLGIVAYCEVVNGCVRLFIASLLVIFSLSIIYIPAAYLVSIIVSMFLCWNVITRKHGINREITKQTNGEDYRFSELLRFSVPLTLSVITNMFRKRFDVILVGFFLPMSKVGIYSTALAVSTMPAIFLYSTNRILMPVASELYGRDSKTAIRTIYKTISKWSVLLTMPVFFSCFIYSRVIISILFGPEYTEGAWALRILLLGTMANFMSGSFGEYLQVFGKTKAVLGISLSGTITNVCFMILLIPHLGVNGAAWGMSLSLFWMCIFGGFLLYRYNGLNPFSIEYAKTVTVGLLVLSNIAWIYTISGKIDNLMFDLFAIVGIIIVYSAILFKIGAVNDEDKLLISSVKIKIAKIIAVMR